MGFTNIIFLFYFFPISVLGYYICVLLENKIRVFNKIRLKDLSIILISVIFYSWALMIDAIKFLVFIFITYIFGKIIRNSNSKKKKIFLIISIVLLISILFIYKYYSVVFNKTDFNLLVPLGLSFIIFSAISYVVDIYRNNCDNNLIDTFMYFTFFPKVVSGPIVLWKDFSREIKNRKHTREKFIDGINLMVIGFSKKVILADTFGSVVLLIREWMNSGIDVLTAIGLVILYSFQLYYDFSGYSDIAIGLSKMFGFDFKDNFNHPYTAISITDFWRRWHISLGNWFKEYVYIPLGGNHKGQRRTLINLMIVFILTGIWHGAGKSYLIWGIFHGIIRVIEKCLENNKIYQKIPNNFKRLITIIFVFFSWEFFMFNSVGTIIDFNKIIFGITKFSRIRLTFRYFFDFRAIIFLIIAIVCSTNIIHVIKEKLVNKGLFKNKLICFMIKEIIVLILLYLSVMFMINSNYSPFIYFQY